MNIVLRETTQNTCSRNTSEPSRPSRRSQVSSSAALSHSMGFQLRSSAAAPGSRLLLPGAPSWRISPSPPDWKGCLKNAVFQVCFSSIQNTTTKRSTEKHTNKKLFPLLFCLQSAQYESFISVMEKRVILRQIGLQIDK